MSAPPPLGNLRGMFWDPEKNRYYPLSAREVKPKPPCQKRQRTDVNESVDARRRMKRSIGGRCREGNYFARCVLHGVTELCQCSGEGVTSLSHYGRGLAVTTDSGQVILGSDEEVVSFAVCSQTLLGVHADIARGTWIAVANGNEPHVHFWRDCFNTGDMPIIEQMTLDIPQRDIFAMSSFGDMTTLGLTRSLNSIVTSEAALSLIPRRLPSDPLKVDQHTRDLVFAGLRNSTILLEDLRTSPGKPNIIAALPRGRAVAGVKRLKDSAVPWGLLASGLDNQLLIYDLRFPKQPLREMDEHVNSFHTTLGMTTSPDDTVVFHGGSDRRLRAWSTITGERIMPASKCRRGVLSMDYRFLVEHIDVSEDLTVRVAAAGDILRFESGPASARGHP